MQTGSRAAWMRYVARTNAESSRERVRRPGGKTMSDEPIPLYDGELPDAKIIPDRSPEDSPDVGTLRQKRATARHTCEHFHVCFAPQLPSGRTEHVECPVFDISKGGISLEFDAKLDQGITGSIEYRTVNHSPVRVTGSVRHSQLLENGHYMIGFRFDRRLSFEELRTAKVRPGRDIVPGVRLRKLRPASDV